MAITLRSVKGSALSHAEIDQNFIDLRDLPTGSVYPKTSGIGIKVDTANPTFPWHDIIGDLTVDETDTANAANFTAYRGGVKARQFITEQTDVAYVNFHIPHDYLANSTIYMHFHWSHANTNVNGGSVTWGAETMYAKGHGRGAWLAPILFTTAQNANTTQYTHMIAEGVLSTQGGSNVALPTEDIEPDGVLQCRIYLDSNDMTVSANTVPAPFVHMVDIHYQSTGIGTKQRSPDFYT